MLCCVEQIKSASHLLTLSTEWANKYHDGYLMWMSYSWCSLRLTAPDTVKAVLGTAEPKDPFVYHFIEQWIGKLRPFS